MKPDLQSIFDALLVGVVVLDDAGAVEFVNSEASRILEASDQHMPGKVLSELLGPHHPLCTILDRFRAGGRASIHDEVEFPRRLAEPLPVDVSVSPVRDPNASQAAPGIALTLRDRTASRSLHEEIRERERQESYGHIAAGIAHEVKNPLGGIRGAAELLGLAATNDRGKKTAQLIVDEVDRISGLVDELMVFARGDDLHLERVNIHRLLDAMLDLLEHERGHEDVAIERLFDPSLPEIEADPARLQQVFLNLARNALQAMESTGRLTLSTRIALDHRLVGTNGRPKPTVEIGFRDTGHGIPAHIQDRLSTPFFTTKKKGTGLGLSVARHWTRRHGGRLRIVSGEGDGTTVYVDLPLSSSGMSPGGEAGTRHSEASPASLPAS
jgi:two-component system nitrogen regulation sensor histidine kinase GlnL